MFDPTAILWRGSDMHHLLLPVAFALHKELKYHVKQHLALCQLDLSLFSQTVLFSVFSDYCICVWFYGLGSMGQV